MSFHEYITLSISIDLFICQPPLRTQSLRASVTEWNREDATDFEFHTALAKMNSFDSLKDPKRQIHFLPHFMDGKTKA